MCIVNRECCKGTVCRLPAPPPPGVFAPGTCDACAVSGESCRVSDECCEGSCVSGVCKKSCSPGAACSVAGAKGECAKGKTECDALGNATCVGPNPVPESCNGKDDDCDGKVDNLPRSAPPLPRVARTAFQFRELRMLWDIQSLQANSSSWCGEGGRLVRQLDTRWWRLLRNVRSDTLHSGWCCPVRSNTRCKEDPGQWRTAYVEMGAASSFPSAGVSAARLVLCHLRSLGDRNMRTRRRPAPGDRDRMQWQGH
ncbi:MAG: hypothetical protein IPJ34_44110 [Myxococcales bacterium]|nr:hypothetical protein [Myxococcales bacterium]